MKKKKKKVGVTERPRSLIKAIPLSILVLSGRALDAWRGMWICVHSKDAMRVKLWNLNSSSSSSSSFIVKIRLAFVRLAS